MDTGNKSVRIKLIQEATKGITLAVPGGLAGQIYAIGYACWFIKKRGLPVHIRFHDVGTDISKLSVSHLLDSKECKRLGISYSVISGEWPVPPSGTVVGFLLKILPFRKVLSSKLLSETREIVRRLWLLIKSPDLGAIDQANSRNGIISKSTMMNAVQGSVISGYPSDIQIIEESWPELSSIIGDNRRSDFTSETGKEPTVAIHWRLGDYIGNSFHGAVAWESIENCLKYANVLNYKVKVFTDSPEVAKLEISRSQTTGIEVVCGTIWSDLFEMTRCQIFIGTNSGISFLAALALRENNSNSQTWLPSHWFLDRTAQQEFQPSHRTFGNSAIYPSKLTDKVFGSD